MHGDGHGHGAWTWTWYVHTCVHSPSSTAVETACPLQAPLYGPLALGALTYGERAVTVDDAVVAVPQSARAELTSLRLRPSPRDAAAAEAARSAPAGCLVTRWEQVWLVHASGRERSFVKAPGAACVRRASPIDDDLSSLSQRPPPHYELSGEAAAAACELDGCVMPGATMPFASGELFLMHNGTGARVVAAAEPPLVRGHRAGGTDAAGASTWRFTRSPLGASVPPQGSYLEAFDRPGHVLSFVPTGGRLVATLSPAGTPGALQRWRRASHSRQTSLESLDMPGHVLGLARADDSVPTGPITHRSAAASRLWQIALLPGAADRAAAPPSDGAESVTFVDAFAQYPAAAFWTRPALNANGTRVRPLPSSRDTFLLFPLNEIVDEHYTVYLCRLPPGRSSANGHVEPPRFCR